MKETLEMAERRKWGRPLGAAKQGRHRHDFWEEEIKNGNKSA